MPVTPLFKVNVVVFIEDASIASLNVTVTALFTAKPVAPFAGLVDETVGGVVSGDVPITLDERTSPPHPITIINKNAVIIL